MKKMENKRKIYVTRATAEKRKEYGTTEETYRVRRKCFKELL